MMPIIFLLVMGTLQLLLGLYWRGWGWLLVWSGGSLLLVGAAYLGLGPGIFGKRPDGGMPLWSRLLFLPFRGFITFFWNLQRRSGMYETYNQIAPGLWLGRRPLGDHELPPDIDTIIDLTAEYEEPTNVVDGRTYRCVPTLDGTAPESEAVRALVEEFAPLDGNIYRHCAAGRGRSAAVAAALLISRGLAENVEAAEQLLQQARPAVSMTQAQKEMVEHVVNSAPNDRE